MFQLETIVNFNLSFEIRRDYIDRLMAKMNFSYLGKGRHRLTFLSPSKKFVLKFPKFENGLWANQSEARKWKRTFGKPDNNNYGVIYAPCRLIQNTILLMTAVVKVYGETEGCDNARWSGLVGGVMNDGDAESLPRWADNYVDSNQVGLLANGKLVAYDYA